jgi:two-component SAPR family response regulator
MAKLVIVDDDYASEILLEHSVYLGDDARRLASVDEALQAVDAIVASDLLILDIIMARSQTIRAAFPMRQTA